MNGTDGSPVPHFHEYHFAHICKEKKQEKNDGSYDLLDVHTCSVRYVVAGFWVAILLRI